MEAMQQLWKDTDKIFQGINNWTAKPIVYRHPFCFYYGHMASYAAIHLLKEEPKTELDIMFSRGIDPIVTDPSKCHKHPEVPALWPDRYIVQNYVKTKRRQILNNLENGNKTRPINLVMEHERMHQETLAYMLVQQRKLNFEAEQQQQQQHHHHHQQKGDIDGCKQIPKSTDVLVSAGEVVLGADPTEGVFRWDNEEPAFVTSVEEDFYVKSEPVSVGEFKKFIVAGGYEREELWSEEDFEFIKKSGQRHPATWSSSIEDDEWYVHTVESTNHWSKVSEVPVYVSLMEAEAYCKWAGGRLMNEAEYQRILNVRDDGTTINKIDKHGWECTSSIFAPFPGFENMSEYPEYSTDFFDGKHYVLKGSSPSTHPSMLRSTFRNFYQRHYPYVFAKFRVCKSSS